jgi:DNA-binding response OmpR family regulator
MDGIDFLKSLREWSKVPVIVFNRPREGRRTRFHALDRGADDYLTKPSAWGELLARIRVALRHAAQSASGRTAGLRERGAPDRLRQTPCFIADRGSPPDPDGSTRS